MEISRKCEVAELEAFGTATAILNFDPSWLMLRYLRKLFRKDSPARVAAKSYISHATAGMVQTRSHPGEGQGAAAAPVPRVETAQLQLAAIIAKFPEELRKLVVKEPAPEAMIALPLPTIQKFLPTGSVKMSLASVVRQAPPGTFAQITTADKRLVEVPLAEIFKRISPAALKKRSDQRFTDLAAEGFDIFGDQDNPHAIAPRFEGSPAFAESEFAQAAPVLGAAPQAPRALQPPLGIGIVPPTNVPTPPRPNLGPAIPPPQIFQRPVNGEENGQRHTQTASPTHRLPLKESEPDNRPPLVVLLKELTQGWPEPIKSEACALNGTTVSLPSSQISLGLAKGKVAFAWGHLRSWMEPVPVNPTEADEATELLLPLRVIAPAFLKHTKQIQQRKSIAFDDSIPPLFGPGQAEPSNESAKEVIPEAEPLGIPELQIIPEIKAEAAAAPPEVVPEVSAPEPTAPAAEAEPFASMEPAEEPVFGFAPVEAVHPEESVEELPATEELPEAVEALVEEEAPLFARVPFEEEQAVTPASKELPPVVEAPQVVTTLGEAFGNVEKTNWSPSEIVEKLVTLPGVGGAAVALQEGLVIAYQLPEPMKGEVFAAFLPQIFARLNQYASEMKLGTIEDIVLQSNNGPCHLFRRGQVFFAALGKVGEPLPTEIVRLCADSLSDH